MNLITITADGQPVTTTLAIAEGTMNDHASVLKLVRTHIESLGQFGGVGFEIQPFETAGGTQQREVALLNEPQSTLLIAFMRNNDVVVKFKIALVKGFYEMRAALTAPKAMSAGEMMLAQCQMLVEQERRVAAVEAQQAEQGDKLKRIEAKQQAFEEGANFFTVLGFFVWRGLPALSFTETAQFGKRATKLSKERGQIVDRVRDPRFGMVNSYHETILQTVLDEWMA